MTHTIYGLRDPDTKQIRYIGYSSNLQQRYSYHLSDPKRTHKGNWIRSLKQKGLKPELVVLEECNADNWAERERAWIAQAKAQGLPLTNATDGGEGAYNPSPETLARRAASLKGNKSKTGQKDSPETLARKAAAHATNTYVMVSPEGVTFTTTSLNAFAREYGLDDGALSRVVNGKYKNHKGWTGHRLAV